MKKMWGIPLLALAAACAPVEPAELSARAQSDLTAALQGLTPAEPVTCVSQRDLRNSRSFGQGVILFEGRGNMVYLNRPAGGCPALGRDRTMVTSTPSGLLCRGEIVSVVDVASNTQFGACSLGDFQAYRRTR